MKVKKNIKPNNLIHISNKYDILDTSYDDYVINIYYLSINKIQIIIRKINNTYGWDNDIKIRIFENNKSEIFFIGSSKKNFKKINFYSQNISFLKKKINDLKIPRKIIQTHKNNDFNEYLAYNSIQTFLEFNPNYEYIFYDDIDCREFIKNNFNEQYLYYYDVIYPGAFKADFFRYCYLYIEGGCYFDCKSILLESLDNLLNKDDELILCQDFHKLGLYNAVMMSAPNNKLFMNLINKIIYKIKNFKEIYNPSLNYRNYIKLDNILSLTGPNLLYEEFKLNDLSYKKHILMKHDIIGNYQNYKNLVIKYNNKLFMYKNYNNFTINSTHYSVLWKNHKIFYKNHSFNNDHHFFVTPDNNHLDIEFYLINNKILIIDSNNLNNIEIKVINNKSEYENILIPYINQKYYIQNYKFLNNFDHSITKIDIDDKIIKDNYEFSINKICNKYYLIILNLNKIKINNANIKIYTKIKDFDFEFSNLINKIYLVYNIDLFNI